MKNKILLFCLILISVLFINICQAKAENYQVGDLVEVINPNGEKSQRFYISGIKKDNQYGLYYSLTSEKPLMVDKTVNEVPKATSGPWTLEKMKFINDDYSYLIDINNSINQNLVFITDLNIDLSSCEPKDQTVDSIYYTDYDIEITCPNFFYNFSNNTFISIYSSSDSITRFKYLERKTNNEFVLKTFLNINDEYANERTTKKLDYYIRLVIEEKNLNLIRKVETEEILNAETTNNIENPKTADVNILLAVLGIGIFTGIIVLSTNELKKIK